MLSCSGNSLQWNLHFWLGEETSQDESTVAAYKSVELDEAMGGGPIQHREVQGSESDLFMSYFKATGIEYLPGGIESGFNKVEKDVKLNSIMSNSFGFGGTNATLVFEKI